MAIRRNEGEKMKKNILVLGAGAWGTAIANLLAENIKEDVLIRELDYFYSNSISRSSKTMNECRQINQKSKKTGTDN